MRNQRTIKRKKKLLNSRKLKCYKTKHYKKTNKRLTKKRECNWAGRRCEGAGAQNTRVDRVAHNPV